MSVLEARNIIVEREAQRSLDNVDFTLTGGEFVGVVGPNGAGKTTLLRTLLGLQKTRSGEVRVNGTLVGDMARGELARAIGYLPQGAAFHWPLTVERAVSLGRYPHAPVLAGMTPNDICAIRTAMRTAGVSAFAERRVDRLSGGERMRVHLARLLAGEHRAIIADEPITSLDAKYQLHFLTLLKQQAAQGVGVIISLHDLSLAARYCDRLVVLKDGQVAVNDVPERALDDRTLETVFEVRAERLHTTVGTSIIPTNLVAPLDSSRDADR